MIKNVVIYNEEDRDGHENKGQVEKIEISGRQFSYIVREAMDFRRLFNYLNSLDEWVSVKKS